MFPPLPNAGTHRIEHSFDAFVDIELVEDALRGLSHTRQRLRLASQPKNGVGERHHVTARIDDGVLARARDIGRPDRADAVADHQRQADTSRLAQHQRMGILLGGMHQDVRSTIDFGKPIDIDETKERDR